MKKIQRNCKDYKKQVSYMGKEMQKYRCFEKELKTELKIRGLTDDQIEEAYKNARMMC